MDHPSHKFVAHRSWVYHLNITGRPMSYQTVDTNVQYQLLYYNKTSRDSHYGQLFLKEFEPMRE